MWNYIYRKRIEEIGLPDSKASKRLVAIFCIGALISTPLAFSPFIIAYLYVSYKWYKLGVNVIGIWCAAVSVYYIWFIYWLFRYYRGRSGNRDYATIFVMFIYLIGQIVIYYFLGQGIASKYELLN